MLVEGFTMLVEGVSMLVEGSAILVEGSVILVEGSKMQNSHIQGYWKTLSYYFDLDVI